MKKEIKRTLEIGKATIEITVKSARVCNNPRGRKGTNYYAWKHRGNE